MTTTSLVGERRLPVSDELPLPMWSSGPDGVRSAFNRRWLEYRGRSADEEACDGWTEAIHLEDRTPCLDALTAGFSAGRPFQVTYRLRGADDVHRWMLDTIEDVRDAGGELLGFRGACVDVTNSRQRELELEDFVENGATGLHWVGPDGVIVWANRAELEMLGYAREEYVGRPITDFHVDRDVVEDILARLARGETLRNVPARMCAKDGSVRHVLIHSNVRWEGERFLHTRCFTRDVTQLVETEQALRRTLEDSHESQDRLAAIFEQALVGLAQSDLEGRFVLVNDRFCEITGRTREQLLGLTKHDITHSEDLERARDLYEGLRAGGSGFTIEKRYVRPDGSEVWVHNSVSHIRRADGSSQGILTVCQDVTAAKKAREALQRSEETLERRVAERTAELERANADLERANQELARANQELDAFSYSVSHDLRAPLRHIRSYTDILREHAERTLDPRSHEYLETIANVVTRAGVMVDALLTLAHISREELVREPIDMNDLVKDVRQQLAPDVNGRVVEWEIGNLPAVHGDRSMLLIAVSNLLSNALKYTRPRERTVISVDGESTNGEATFRITDNGVGFDMRYAGKLFGVFQRLHKDPQFEGIGVGLANVHRIVHRHGGTVWAKSAPDVGTTLTFCLPTAPPTRPRVETP